MNQQLPEGFVYGGAAPISGMRHRIRTRVSVPLVFMDSTEYENELLEESLADGSLVSEEEVEAIRQTIWKPKGPNPPQPHTITMGYHTAWDIGKKGCVALKLRNNWDSTVNPARLRFFIMDGTDPIAFLSIYTKHHIRSDSDATKQKKGTLLASAVRDGIWSYTRGRIKVQRYEDQKKFITIDRLPQQFMDAIVVCIREMEVYREVIRLKSQRVEQRRATESRRLMLKKLLIEQDRRLSVLKNNRRHTEALTDIQNDWSLSNHQSPSNEDNSSPVTIQAKRALKLSLIAPNSEAVLSAIQSTKRKSLQGSKSINVTQQRRANRSRFFRRRVVSDEKRKPQTLQLNIPKHFNAS